MAKANRGYIFEAVWAAAVSARFYKRIGGIEKIKKPEAFKKSASYRMQIGTLPRITSKDTQDMLVELWSNGKQLRKQTQNDINFKSIVKDYLIVNVMVPEAVDNFISNVVTNKNFNEINDFIRVSTAIANSSSELQSRVKAVAFNGFVDTINISANGLTNQRTVKSDVTVNIQSGDPKTRINPFQVSCKVPGGEQFAQISGLEFDKFVSLFKNLGMSIPLNIKIEWENSVNQFITEGIFEKKYSTRKSIKQLKAPEKTKRAAAKVYSAMASQMRINFPTNQFANFVYTGFTNGVDTEVIKLTESKKSGNKVIVGGKTLTVDNQFRKILSQQTYNVVNLGPTIKIYANGISGYIMQFRYRWENPSHTVEDTKTYKMYARHLLEVGPGMFKIDPRSQEIAYR